MTSVVQDLLLVLCLLLRKACGDFVAEDLHVVDGLINQYITLPCSFPIPDNWKGQDIHITWYKNFTDKLLDCMVRDGKTPVCQKYPDSSRIQLSWKFLGNADLDIYRFQESDEGPYQCWVIFDDAYQRQDTLLRFHGDLAGRRDASLFDGFVGWHSILVVSTWNVLLLSGWPFSLLLAWIFLSQRCHNRRKGKRINI
ncbi:uncharacterized protein LOC120942922 isoform X2 [Rana temporaria]|nr:uncharacterized protein LOC120942922 isoform X2 [Rana temporaria]